MANIDLTPVLTAVISLCCAAVTYVIVPWIRAKYGADRAANIMKWARIAASAAEQIYGAKKGELKAEYVRHYLLEHGVTVSETEIKAALEAAVFEMSQAVDRVDAIGFDVEDDA